MNACKVDVPNIISRIIVADLATRPVETFDLYHFIILDRAAEGNLDMSGVVSKL